MDIGFLGLGLMGSAMVVNLLKAGHRVRVWNRSPGPVQELVAQGAQAATSPQDALQAADAVLTILADDQAMRAVLLDSGLIDAAPQGPVHVHMATISVALAEELTQRYRARGIAYVAAPVFGRPEVAALGKLHIVAAGDDAAITRVHPLLDLLGQTWRMGDVPARANVVKLAGNFMIASAIEAMGEAVALAQGHGVQARELLGMLTGSVFSAQVYKAYGNIIAERNYDTVGAKLSLGLKDVRLVLAAGERANVPLPLASLVRDSLLDSIAHGDGARDWSAFAEVSRRRAGQVE